MGRRLPWRTARRILPGTAALCAASPATPRSSKGTEE